MEVRKAKGLVLRKSCGTRLYLSFGSTMQPFRPVRWLSLLSFSLRCPKVDNHFPEKCSAFEAGSYVRLSDSCITRLEAQGPSRTSNESKEEKVSACRPREQLYKELSPDYSTGATVLFSRLHFDSISDLTHNLALTVLCVPYSLDSGRRACAHSDFTKSSFLCKVARE